MAFPFVLLLSLHPCNTQQLSLPSVSPQKCLRLNPDVPVWASKQRILCTLNHSLKDVLNYGLFQPAFNGRAGKFLDEERLLREYPLNPDTPVPYLEVAVFFNICIYKYIRVCVPTYIYRYVYTHMYVHKYIGIIPSLPL